MLADQFLKAAVSGRTAAVLDELARKLWRAYAEGVIAGADAEAISGAIEARRAALAGKAAGGRSPKSARRLPLGFLEPLAAGRRFSASAARAPSTATPRSGSCTGRAA